MGRAANVTVVDGIDRNLMPLLTAMGVGTVAGLIFLARTGVQSPDVSFDRTNNQYPWNKQTTQFKFYNTGKIDYNNLHVPADRPSI